MCLRRTTEPLEALNESALTAQFTLLRGTKSCLVRAQPLHLGHCGTMIPAVSEYYSVLGTNRDYP